MRGAHVFPGGAGTQLQVAQRPRDFLWADLVGVRWRCAAPGWNATRAPSTRGRGATAALPSAVALAARLGLLFRGTSRALAAERWDDVPGILDAFEADDVAAGVDPTVSQARRSPAHVARGNAKVVALTNGRPPARVTHGYFAEHLGADARKPLLRGRLHQRRRPHLQFPPHTGVHAIAGSSGAAKDTPQDLSNAGHLPSS